MTSYPALGLILNEVWPNSRVVVQTRTEVGNPMPPVPIVRVVRKTGKDRWR
jgi:hypothetical protein